MMIVDCDNLVGMRISDTQAKKLKEAMDAGLVSDCVGDVCTWLDCIDGAGDICLDEEAYEQAMAIIKEECHESKD